VTAMNWRRRSASGTAAAALAASPGASAAARALECMFNEVLHPGRPALRCGAPAPRRAGRQNCYLIDRTGV
jgi:hypothetical protein